MQREEPKDEVTGSNLPLLPVAALSRQHILPEDVATTRPSSELAARFVFRLGAFTFSINIEKTCQLIDIKPPRRLPGTPDWLAGIVNIRGQLVPVFDLETYIGAHTQMPLPKRVLMFGEQHDAVAFYMREIPARRVFKPSQALSHTPPLPGKLQGLILRAYADNRAIWLDLDHEKLLQRLQQHLTHLSADDAA